MSEKWWFGWVAYIGMYVFATVFIGALGLIVDLLRLIAND